MVVARVTGEDAIACWRNLMGPTNTVPGAARLMRGDLATVIGENIVHGSDSPASAERELAAVLRVAGGMPGLRRPSTGSACPPSITSRRRTPPGWRSPSPISRRPSASWSAASPTWPPRRGPPTTRFQIGSISKSFASLLVLQEEAAGTLALDVSVNEILPWLGLEEPFGRVTLHHLMTHTAGLLVGTEDAPTGPGALHRLRTVSPTTLPGERFLYSNDGWKVVGLPGGGHRDLGPRPARRADFGPLGMTSSARTDGPDAEHLTTAIGYEPVFGDRPVQLRHPLMPATWIVSDTADGSIVSHVLDMGAYARLLSRAATSPTASAAA